MKNVLITGGAGFIGSKICKKFIDNDYNVYTIDNLSTGQIHNIPKKVNFINGNCQDKSIFTKLQNLKFEAIFHIAGQSSGEISFDDPLVDLESNTSSTINLLKFSKQINCRHFYYASSMSVYGNKNAATKESETLNPNSFYGIGKLASEKYLELYSKMGINVITYRLFNVYGPGQDFQNFRQGMVSIFISQANSFNKIVVKGSLERYRDFIFIDDVVSAFFKGFKLRHSGYRCYNLCSGEKTKVNELLEKITKIFDNNIEIKVKGPTDGDVNGIYGDNSKIKKELEWRCETELFDGLKIMYDSIKND